MTNEKKAFDAFVTAAHAQFKLQTRESGSYRSMKTTLLREFWYAGWHTGYAQATQDAADLEDAHEADRRSELREEMQRQRREETSERAEFDAATEGVRGW